MIRLELGFKEYSRYLRLRQADFLDMGMEIVAKNIYIYRSHKMILSFRLLQKSPGF